MDNSYEQCKVYKINSYCLYSYLEASTSRCQSQFCLEQTKSHILVLSTFHNIYNDPSYNVTIATMYKKLVRGKIY